MPTQKIHKSVGFCAGRCPRGLREDAVRRCACATGTHSSRKIERVIYDSPAFRRIACDQHPGREPLANLRRRSGEQVADIFVQVPQVAFEN